MCDVSRNPSQQPRTFCDGGMAVNIVSIIFVSNVNVPLSIRSPVRTASCV